ncbi:phosphatase PAP2 family protein [Bdellovibrionota bacterium FG-1]
MNVKLVIPSEVRALPLFVSRGNKWPAGVVMYGMAAAVYLLCNHFHLFPPQELTRSWLDLTIPFFPQSIWIYTSEYLFFASLYYCAKDILNLNKYLYSFLCLQFMSCMIFLLWPTTYPRHLFPLPDTLDSATRFVFASLRTADTPASCCPSLHVSSVYLSSFIFLDEQRRLFPVFFIWSTAIAFSTLTTKQHYVWDVVAGMMMAMFHYWFFHRHIRYRKARISFDFYKYFR